jgi:PPOX class probable F420-dependent enzyme
VRLNQGEARTRFVTSAVLRLATAGADGRPHLVPCTFAVDGADRIVIGIDNKPKSSRSLRRLENIAANPQVSLLADDYTDNWAELWWARADGIAAIERSGPRQAGYWHQLRRKYPQYEGQVLDGPVIVVDVLSWSGWAYS